jgi:hypothetical protein
MGFGAGLGFWFGGLAGGGGFIALALEHGEQDFGEGGLACLLGFGFAGDGGCFEVHEEAEEGEFAVDERVDEGVCDGVLVGAGAGEHGLGEAAAVPCAAVVRGRVEVVVVVGGIGRGNGIVGFVEERVGHGCS